MTTNKTPPPSNWRTRLLAIWKGNGKPSRWFIRILLIFVLYQAINWLWQNSLLTARWTRPGKSFSLVFVVVTILATAWMLITIWRLLSAFGGKSVVILLVVWYAFAVGVKLLTLPPEQPILPALREQMTIVAKEGVVAIPRGIAGIPKAMNDFRFAYTGQRNLIDLPGIDEPDEPLTGRIIEPNYITLIETPTPVQTPGVRQGTPSPTIPAQVPIRESEDFEATPSPLPNKGEINIGVYVVVANTDGDPLRAHITPGVDTEIITRFPEGSRVLVLDGPVIEDDLIWWLVEGDQGKGWCAESFLELVVDNN